MIPLTVTFTQQDSFAKCMMRAVDLNLDNYHVRTEMTCEKHLLILNVCFTENSEPKEFLVDETLS